MLGVDGVDLFCGRVHLQTRETKEKPRETKGNQGKTKEKPRENQGKTKEKPRETKGDQGKTKGNQGNKETPFNQQKKYLPINGSIFNQ